jgi:phage gp36-like protein
MSFLTADDYSAVTDAQTLDVIMQSDPANRQRAELYAIEEISAYIRTRYNATEVFAATGDQRNNQMVMLTADVALYHLIAWLPKKMGFEIRELRYKRAIEFLEAVQAGKVSPDFPPLLDPQTGENAGIIKFGSMQKGKHDY